MFNSFYLAWKYLSFNKLRTSILISCVTLISSLPIILNSFLDESEKQLISRAKSTPLIIGAKASDLDLTINSLYFTSQPPEKIKFQEINQVKDTKLARAIPIYSQFKARDYPIIGTSIEYFRFRNLNFKSGSYFAMIGDCVIGASVAKKLDLKIGDSIISSPQNLFDLGGIYPLKMKIVGILAANQTADDQAIFVDIKTTWVIEGLGHGHIDLVKSASSDLILEQGKKNISANAKLQEYNEITPENINSFHFHGNSSKFPLTAIIAIPHEQKSATLLRGVYQSEKSSYQIINPRQVIEELLLQIFQIKNILNGIFLVVTIATFIAIFLIFNLSLRLRQREINTNFYLGCSRSMIRQLILAEITIILVISLSLTALITNSLSQFNRQWFERIITITVDLKNNLFKSEVATK